MIFMLSASRMSLSNELSSVLLKVSHLVARYSISFICKFYQLLHVEYKQVSPPKERVGGLTLFRSHPSMFLSAVGSIFHIFCPLEVQLFRFMSVQGQVHFICLL